MRHVASGAFFLRLPAEHAIGLFTPEGERDWVPGWAPVYPDGPASEMPGSVFITEEDGVRTTWVIAGVDRIGGSARYARLTPGLHAGSVDVRVADAGSGRCRVEVRYDMTLLDDAPPQALAPYDPDAFPVVMREWRDLLVAHLEGRP